ncbi:MAG: CocE/NonD family hydrolase [Synechococcales cyanobacterium RM1_1_8]|nr:CocE/NonD family hydrolase [Synechococcales cyanobacterium RM1_1_8]
MTTRDGTRLDADLYRPPGPGPFPVLLMRQPYGRAIASTVVYAHPRWYAAQGYIVIIQDVRGRGSSEGDFQLFASETNDGEDSIYWAAALPDSSGSVGMYGFSYQGMTQLYAASRSPEPLKALCPAMVAYDLYCDWAYEGGAFCLQASLAWAIQIAAETARIRGDATAYAALRAAALAPSQPPPGEERPSQPALLTQFAPESFYHDWVEQSSGDQAYWQSLVPNLTDVDLPMLHIGGWFDPYLRGTLNLYQRVASPDSPLQMQSPQHLWVGPWGHLPWGRRVGALDFGPAAVSPIDRLQVRWFDHFLKGEDRGLLGQQPVSLFEMGGNAWRSHPTWPTPAPQVYELFSNGFAALDEGAGELRQAAIAQPAIAQTAMIEDILVHDPWRPVPSLGGHAAWPNGPVERSAIEARSDVLTYSTAPLGAELTLAGAIALEVYCETEAPSFDLCAVLSELRPDGSSFHLSQGYLHIAPADKQSAGPYRIELQATCCTIPPGHGLRLSLSAACFPAYGVNPGTGQHPNVASQLEQQVITLRILSGSDRPSRLLLPQHLPVPRPSS